MQKQNNQKNIININYYCFFKKNYVYKYLKFCQKST